MSTSFPAKTPHVSKFSLVLLLAIDRNLETIEEGMLTSRRELPFSRNPKND